MSEMFALAVRKKGDSSLLLERFTKDYGKARFSIHSYAPPTFRMTSAITVDVLRGIALFYSLYGQLGMSGQEKSDE
ncbi:MAG: hypothetical protein Q9228_003147 [Teloschistes exilis]